MTEDKVAGKQTEFDNLAQEFTARLRHRVPTHVIPFTRPPCNVGIVASELTGQSKSDDELVDKALDSDHGNHTEDCSGKIEVLEEEHDFKHDEEHDDRDGMCYSCQNGTELLAAHAEDRSHTTCHTEEADCNTRINGNRSEGDDTNPQQSVILFGRAVSCCILHDTCLSVDEEEWDQSQSNHYQWRDDLAQEDVGKVSPRNIARDTRRWFADRFLLVTSDTSS